jgi:hypothetical protein
VPVSELEAMKRCGGGIEGRMRSKKRAGEMKLRKDHGNGWRTWMMEETGAVASPTWP